MKPHFIVIYVFAKIVLFMR